VPLKLAWQAIAKGSDVYPMDGDWVFANPRMKGKQPYWPDNLMKR
jgi:hypothetical protein